MVYMIIRSMFPALIWQLADKNKVYNKAKKLLQMTGIGDLANRLLRKRPAASYSGSAYAGH